MPPRPKPKPIAAAIPSCHECRTEANCTEVCPKGISPTRAIKYIQRVALTHANKPIEEATEPTSWSEHEIDRATFLRQAGVMLLGAGVAVALGSVAVVTTIGPETKQQKAN